MAIKTGNLKIPEPKPPVDRQPRDEKGKWIPPSTRRIQPKEQTVTGPARPRTYMDTHRHVKGTALDKPGARIEAPAPAPGTPASQAKDRFTKKEAEEKPGKAGKGTKK